MPEVFTFSLIRRGKCINNSHCPERYKGMDEELKRTIKEQAIDMNSQKVILPKPKRRKMTKQDHIKWDEMKEKRGRL